MLIPIVYDLNVLLLEYLDIFKDFYNLILCNKFCKSLVEKNKLYILFKELNGKENSLKLILNKHQTFMFNAIQYNEIQVVKYYLDNKLFDSKFLSECLKKILFEDNIDCLLFLENNYAKMFCNNNINTFLDVVCEYSFDNDYGKKITTYFIDKIITIGSFQNDIEFKRQLFFNIIILDCNDLLENGFIVVKDSINIRQIGNILYNVYLRSKCLLVNKQITFEFLLEFLFKRIKCSELETIVNDTIIPEMVNYKDFDLIKYCHKIMVQ